MLSVFFDCGAVDEALAKSLAALVPGAVEGVVREVVIVDRGLDPAAREVAEHAGCDVVAPAELSVRVDRARGEWLLFLEPGARLMPGWIDAVVEHGERVAAGRASNAAARFTRAHLDRPGFLKRFRQIRTALAEGFLVRKNQASALMRVATGLEEAARGVAVTRLGAEIRPARA